MEFYWPHLPQRHLCLSTNRICRGEPLPVAKPVGGEVFGATVSQLAKLAVVHVTASGITTVLAKIVIS